ncbi:hypothetical protein L2E82_00942 [Cichorium intybus]|uniref:Uncharacterized protein n=1 Tax=Cichorium intybus TaxID=13427 RepID=A0ACB9GXH5_CICIN|nr:hypothetical protein L2E82_00942 [Cichorium intybus]
MAVAIALRKFPASEEIEEKNGFIYTRDLGAEEVGLQPVCACNYWRALRSLVILTIDSFIGRGCPMKAHKLSLNENPPKNHSHGQPPLPHSKNAMIMLAVAGAWLSSLLPPRVLISRSATYLGGIYLLEF